MSQLSKSPPEVNPRRWLALVFIGLAQLMIVLDITVVNIALPSAQKDLGISDGDRQWVITAYTLAFGSLLLLGGRIADYTGRKRTFLIGLLGFAGASALGGAASGFEMLLSARALQGGFAALLAPATLSLLAVNFTEARERAKAFGIFGAIAAGGGAIGLVIGGLLTEYLDWRWCLYVNVPIAIVAAISWSVLPADTRTEGRARFDIPGVLLAVGGLVAVVYGCSEAESKGWDSRLVTGLLILGAVLLVAFVLVERSVARPLLPPRVLADRTRGSAYLAVGLSVVGMFAMFLFLTYYMQLVKGYSALLTGVAFLPMTGAVLIGAGGVASRLIPKVPPRLLVAPGLLIAAAGVALLVPLDVDSSYAVGLLLPELLVGFGMGLVMAPAMNYATHGVEEGDAGIASATVNTAQQIGGSIGTAMLNTIATSVTSDYMASHARQMTPRTAKAGLVEGFSQAFVVSSLILVGAAVVVALLMNTPRPVRQPGAEGATPLPAHMG
ncbi:MFS transporter [Streptomyces samsunensis]|uniref:Puromycin resistance protein pur8 n=2 Tax=Streptomyces TaxID=1883 RepID=A0A2J7YXC9_STRMQ|nr:MULTISPECIES: MFS transporter [Streptomyces]MYU14956.1 DHA2 family efflux MFS transporter permease subunit [Streptomyces sp. SID8361]AQA14227.1 MFS transporter [Streptomyces autolyticus]MCD9594431.1 MFS transporter [Streptomyces sp. 8ZJF_21]MCM3807637.1 MFS transporter [Streptomyces sp. DR7-3]NUH36595.1 MFS transporter [Streptomyces samsunensis]